MQTYHFFDCNASFGLRSHRNPGSFYKKEELLQKLNDYSIDKALVYHAMAKEYDPQVGNDLLIEELGDQTALSPMWVALPHYTGEFDEPEILAKKMKQHGVRAVTMFPSPSCQNYSLAYFTCGELFRTLEEYRIPLFIGLDQLGGLPALDTLCAAHPKLQIVVTGVNYRIDRDLYPLMQKHTNFSIETSGYKVMDGIAEICVRFGAQRLLFGTGMPLTSGSAAVGLITYANISDKEKQMIASGNLIRLLEGVRL
ncbi:MAG: amidohydrolase family protein [Acetanaerobacterium sp.]